MKTEAIFDVCLYDTLKPGEFFFHPLSGGHNPAMKITVGGETRVLDFTFEDKDGKIVPQILEDDDFGATTVIRIPNAILRPTDGLNNVLNGAGSIGSPVVGALILSPKGVFVKAKHKFPATPVVKITDGSTGHSIDSSTCAWSPKWEVVIRDGETVIPVFSYPV